MITASEPQLIAVFPRRAPPGSMITISVGRTSPITSIELGGVAVTEWSWIAGGRIRARVPALPPGSHSLRGRTSTSEQVLPNAFAVDGVTSRTTMASGDILTLSIPYGIYPGSPPRYVEWLDPNGFVNQIWLPSEQLVESMFIDPQGLLNVVGWNFARRYDVGANDAGAGPAYLHGAAMVLFDRNGNAVKLFRNSIQYYTSSGTLVRSIDTGSFQSPRGDLAADQCTFYAAAGHETHVYDVCTGAALGSLPVPGRAVRILPDGNLITLHDPNIIVARPDGTIVRTLPHNDNFPGMAITPDATTVIIIGSKVQAYDVATGALRVLRPERELGPMGMMAIHGGWFAARGAEAYAIDPAIQSVANGDGVAGSTATINGSGFMPGARVLVNGVEATVTNVTPTQITFVIPAGTTPPPRTITVINPNGQSVVFGSNAPTSHVHAVPALDWRGLVMLGLLLAVAALLLLPR